MSKKMINVLAKLPCFIATPLMRSYVFTPLMLFSFLFKKS